MPPRGYESLPGAPGRGAGCLVLEHVSVSAGVCARVGFCSGGLPFVGGVGSILHTSPGPCDPDYPLVLLSSGCGGFPKQRRQTPRLVAWKRSLKVTGCLSAWSLLAWH